MTRKTISISLAIAIGLLAGCSHAEEQDSSPLPNQDSATRVQNATKNVESSKMTPEEKKAAEEYLKQGAAGADQMRKMAQQAGGPK